MENFTSVHLGGFFLFDKFYLIITLLCGLGRLREEKLFPSSVSFLIVLLAINEHGHKSDPCVNFV